MLLTLKSGGGHAARTQSLTVTAFAGQTGGRRMDPEQMSRFASCRDDPGVLLDERQPARRVKQRHLKTNASVIATAVLLFVDSLARRTRLLVQTGHIGDRTDREHG